MVHQVLLSRVATKAKKLILVIVSAGGVDLNETGAEAVVWAPYGGEEAGNGLADILWGRVNPSGHLPLTFYKQQWADAMNTRVENSILNMNLEVGRGRTHRYVDETFVKHRFGFGLSYTTFRFQHLSITVHSEGLACVVTVSNTGNREGSEVVQVYLSRQKSSVALDTLPSVEPLRSLVGFKKVRLAPGASKTVTIEVPTMQLETALDDGTRAVLSGTYDVAVGGHQPGDIEGEHGSGPCLVQQVQLGTSAWQVVV